MSGEVILSPCRRWIGFLPGCVGEVQIFVARKLDSCSCELEHLYCLTAQAAFSDNISACLVGWLVDFFSVLFFSNSFIFSFFSFYHLLRSSLPGPFALRKIGCKQVCRQFDCASLAASGLTKPRGPSIKNRRVTGST
ncbi:hypothetical protein VTH06DRAFT_8356 [Thermothelomyces fergusii]